MERDKEWDEKIESLTFGMQVAAFPFLLLNLFFGASSSFLADHIAEFGRLMAVAMALGAVIGWRRASKRLGSGTDQ